MDNKRLQKNKIIRNLCVKWCKLTLFEIFYEGSKILVRDGASIGRSLSRNSEWWTSEDFSAWTERENNRRISRHRFDKTLGGCKVDRQFCHPRNDSKTSTKHFQQILHLCYEPWHRIISRKYQGKTSDCNWTRSFGMWTLYHW